MARGDALRYTEAYETNHKEAGGGGICVTGEGVTAEESGLDRTSAMGKSDRADCMTD